MLREEVEQVKTMIENAFRPLQQQVNATFDELKKEIAALKKEIAKHEPVKSVEKKK